MQQTTRACCARCGRHFHANSNLEFLDPLCHACRTTPNFSFPREPAVQPDIAVNSAEEAKVADPTAGGQSKRDRCERWLELPAGTPGIRLEAAVRASVEFAWKKGAYAQRAYDHRRAASLDGDVPLSVDVDAAMKEVEEVLFAGHGEECCTGPWVGKCAKTPEQ